MKEMFAKGEKHIDLPQFHAASLRKTMSMNKRFFQEFKNVVQITEAIVGEYKVLDPPKRRNHLMIATVSLVACGTIIVGVVIAFLVHLS